jgi:hypothetical protein
MTRNQSKYTTFFSFAIISVGKEIHFYLLTSTRVPVGPTARKKNKQHGKGDSPDEPSLWLN